MRGGKRENSGRKKVDSKVFYKRVPTHLYEEIKVIVNEKIKASK